MREYRTHRFAVGLKRIDGLGADKTEKGLRVGSMMGDLTKKVEWCPQHGYPEPCVKCNGMTQAECDEFFRSLANAIDER